LNIFKENDFYSKMVDEVVISLTTVISSYKKGEENPLDSLTYLKKENKSLFYICLKEFRSYYSLHCLEEKVFLFFSLFLINPRDGRKSLDLKKEKEKLIVFMLQRFKQSVSATNGDFKQFLGELGKFIALMTIIFIFIPIIKSENLKKIEAEEEMSKSQKEMILMVKRANTNFIETDIEDIFINYVTNLEIKRSINSK